eukprot:105697-Rhodomonas_salina.2
MGQLQNRLDLSAYLPTPAVLISPLRSDSFPAMIDPNPLSAKLPFYLPPPLTHTEPFVCLPT